MYNEGDVIRIGEGGPVAGYEGVVLRAVDGNAFEIDGMISGNFEVISGVGIVLDGSVGPWTFTREWQAVITKIGEGELYVGQRVVIREDSMYYGKGLNNPANIVGTISQYGEGHFCFEVVWDNGTSNTYGMVDLAPAAARPVKAVKTKAKKKVKPRQTSIQKAAELLRNHKEKVVAKYCILYEGQAVKINSTKVCHSGLDNGRPGAQYVVSCVKRAIDDHPWFYRWLIDDSPWAPAFARRYRWTKENKVVVVRTDISSTFMHGALFATRIWEPHIQVGFMKKWRKKFPLEFLYPISCMYQEEGGQFRMSRSSGGHFPFNHMPSEEVVRNFIRGTPKNSCPPYKETGRRGDYVNDVFGEMGSDEWVIDLFKRTKGLESKDVWGGSIKYTTSKKVFESFLQKAYDEVK